MAAQTRAYTLFMAYDTDGKLRLVGGGVPPQSGKNLGIRWEIGRVETRAYPTADALLRATVELSEGIARD